MAIVGRMVYKGLTKKFGKQKAQKALPFIFGGVAFGTTVWLVAKNWDKITEFAKKVYPLNDATDESLGHSAAIEGKPYPVEQTSKKHSKSQALFKDIQKITQV